MSNSKLYLRFILLGGAAFWLPDILLTWILPQRMVWPALFFVVPMFFILFWLWAVFHDKLAGHPISMPSLFLFGIWFFGPPAMFLGEQLAGTAGSDSGWLESIGAVFAVWVFFPLTTFMMSAYHGSMGGLLWISFLLLLWTLIGGLRRLANKGSSA
jgi:hypothetical protein